MRLLPELLEKGEENKDAVTVFKLAVERKNSAEPVPMNRDNFKSLRDRWATIEPQLKEEKRDGRQGHEDSVKQTKSMLPAVCFELDEAVEDLSGLVHPYRAQ